uniref:Uncharacterized protein n=1 Tax=Leersia perrieri TaxID=77586 RepID=A0A0D9XWR4_9ORYZ
MSTKATALSDRSYSLQEAKERGRERTVACVLLDLLGFTLTCGPDPSNALFPRVVVLLGRVAFLSPLTLVLRNPPLHFIHSSMLSIANAAMAARTVSSASTCRRCLPAQAAAASSKPSTSSYPGTDVLVVAPSKRGSLVSKGAIRGAKLEAAARCSLLRGRPLLLATVSVGSLVAAGAANATEIGDSLVRKHYVPLIFYFFLADHKCTGARGTNRFLPAMRMLRSGRSLESAVAVDPPTRPVPPSTSTRAPEDLCASVDGAAAEEATAAVGRVGSGVHALTTAAIARWTTVRCSLRRQIAEWCGVSALLWSPWCVRWGRGDVAWPLCWVRGNRWVVHFWSHIRLG